MFSPLSKTKGNPSAIDFEALRQAADFNRNVPRLRVLKSEADLAPQALPPSLEQEENQLQQLQTLVSHLPEPDSPPDASSTVAEATAPLATEPQPLANHDQAAIARQIRLKKSKLRCEKLKDLQHGLNHWQAQISEKSSLSPDALAVIKQRLLSLQMQISSPYGGKTALTEQEGMGIIRPILMRQAQKIECLRQDQGDKLPAVQKSEAKALSKLQQQNPIPPLERAALSALAKALDGYLALCFARLERPSQQEDLPPDDMEPTLPADTEWDPQQLESRLFQLRGQLRKAAVPEQANIEAELAHLSQRQQAVALEKRQALLQRSQRSLDGIAAQLRQVQSQLKAADSEMLSRKLFGSCLGLKNACLKELHSLRAALLPQLAPQHPLGQALLMSEKCLGYFQAQADAPHPLNRADREWFKKAGQAAEDQGLLSQAFQGLAERLEALSDAFIGLKKEVQTRLKQSKLMDHLSRLEAFESALEQHESAAEAAFTVPLKPTIFQDILSQLDDLQQTQAKKPNLSKD